MAAQMRDKIVKEGLVRYRQSTIGLQKWRPRHLVFKVTHAGRLQLIVHKESPATAANEIKEIPIDEFGGLENNLKLDSEKYVFAIITTNVTECFSTDSPQELTEWSQLLQEYLGKELVININVPMKQQLLKAGSGRLRIRNTGFTITTCDNPPRCQGTWHIIHIRKYGGSDMFRFQTGSKCPTGEYLYAIETKDNAGIKKLFNDLSNHRPIFSDDRLGRRMTLEKSFNRSTLNTQSRTGNNRLSLQSVDRNRHIYENREKIHESLDMHNAPRRASFDDSALDPPHMDNPSDTRQSKVFSGEDDKLYQNVHPSNATQPCRASPTKKTHLTAVSVPVPEGYYAVTPPPLVRKHHSGNASPSSSPEQTSIREDSVLVDSHPNRVSLPDREQDIAMDIVGDSLVISKSSRQRFTPPCETGENGGMYQNLEFMNGPGEDHVLKRPSSEISSILPCTSISEEPWSPHNYTNVEFAQATAQGKTGSARKVKSRKHRTASENAPGKPLEQRTVERKISMPVKTVPRKAPLQRTPHVVSTSSDDLLSPSQSENSSPGLRNSVSDQELNSKDKSLDYYNFLAPKLPAHSKDHNKTLSLRGKLTLSGGRQSVESPDHSNGSEIEKNSQVNSSGKPSVAVSPAYASIDDYKVLSNGITHGGKMRHRRSSSCDCLEIVSHDGKPEVQDIMYDKLVPLGTVHAADALYDRLGPGKESKSESSSPDPESLPAGSRKSSYLRKAHTYEMVDGETDEQESERSQSSSPEHPSTWTSSLPVGTSSHFFLSKETKTMPRRKHLPLQESDEKNRFEAMYHATGKIRLSRESSVDATEHHGNRSATQTQMRLSLDSSEVLSSIESEPRQESGSSSSIDQSSLTNARREQSNSPIHRVTHEAVELKRKEATNSRLEMRSNTFDQLASEKQSSPGEKGRKKRHESKGSPPIPPRSQEPRFTVPLPHAQFDFNKPPPPPRPKMLYSPGLSYAAVTFANGDGPVYAPHIDSTSSNQRSSMKISQTGSDVSYASVDFQMTAGLQRTSEQVADHQREFFETKQSQFT